VTRTVLIVEDEAALRSTLRRYLARRGMEVLEAATCAEGFAILDEKGDSISAMLVDVSLPDGLGFELVDHMAGKKQKPGVIMMTGDSSIDNAIVALQRGATDFLLKPFSLEALDTSLDRIATVETVQKAKAGAVGSADAREVWRNKYAPGFLGSHPELLQVFAVLESVADTDCTVSVSGETGTGKELVARALHAASDRRNKPFVTVNCAAIPDNLLESELFGHARGAFTGALQARQGRFTQADGGTIFLDEIGEMPLALQAKLLRVLQEREVTPLGEARSHTVDVRVVAATNKDLEEMAETGKFREDLLYRLNVIPVHLPPLRERRGDVQLLVEHFIARTNQRRSRTVAGIDPEAMDALANYEWPGNVRQLENTMERMVLLRSTGVLTMNDVPAKIREARRTALAGNMGDPQLPADGIDLRDAVEQFENALIRQALERTGWNKNRAATILQMNRTTLVEKLKKKGWDEAEAKVA